MSRTRYYKKKKRSTLTVITKAKELIDITFTYTKNYPKIDRFTLKDKIRNTTLEILELLVEANEVYIDYKLIKDLNKSIKAMKEKKKKMMGSQEVDTNEMLFVEQKLLTLKLTAATELNTRLNKRRDLQNKVFAKLSMLDYYIEISYKKKLINSKKEQIWSEALTDVSNLLGAWIKSDRKRFNY